MRATHLASKTVKQVCSGAWLNSTRRWYTRRCAHFKPRHRHRNAIENTFKEGRGILGTSSHNTHLAFLISSKKKCLRVATITLEARRPSVAYKVVILCVTKS